MKEKLDTQTKLRMQEKDKIMPFSGHMHVTLNLHITEILIIT